MLTRCPHCKVGTLRRITGRPVLDKESGQERYYRRTFRCEECRESYRTYESFTPDLKRMPVEKPPVVRQPKPPAVRGGPRPKGLFAKHYAWRERWLHEPGGQFNERNCRAAAKELTGLYRALVHAFDKTKAENETRGRVALIGARAIFLGLEIVANTKPFGKGQGVWYELLRSIQSGADPAIRIIKRDESGSFVKSSNYLSPDWRSAIISNFKMKKIKRPKFGARRQVFSLNIKEAATQDPDMENHDG
jgi:hypothetical protein